MLFVITFPGRKRVNVEYEGYTIMTDQPIDSGGEGTAPTPFELFMASIGSCAGVYALNFCQSRGIQIDGLKVRLKADYSKEEKRVTAVTILIKLPSGFPNMYKAALRRSVESCTVKRNIQNPPQFQVTIND